MIEEDTGPHGVLVFKLHSARDLKAADKNGLSDPYVLIKLPGQNVQPWRSRTIRKTLNPDWEQEHEFPGYLADLVRQPLELRVFDFDVLSFNDPIGTLSINLFDLMQQRLAIERHSADDAPTRRVAQLHFDNVPLEGVDTGTISFSVSFELKFVVGLLPGTPVHASAAQALRRPPPSDASCFELFRDRLLLLLGHQLFLWIAIVWTMALCGFGAFAALTFGALFLPQIIVKLSNQPAETASDWQTIGLLDWQLEMWSNLCVQVLTALFSYFNLLTLPWRLSILFHACGPRSDAPGRDFYGRPTEAIWFHIPRRTRCLIICLLLSSTASHFATQSSRFIYPSYTASNSMPGVVVCNATFIASMVLGIIAGFVQSTAERQLVKAHPERFPPSLWSHIQDLRQRGEFSCCALLCCRLGTSHDAARTGWHIERELGKLGERLGVLPERRDSISSSSRSFRSPREKTTPLSTSPAASVSSAPAVAAAAMLARKADDVGFVACSLRWPSLHERCVIMPARTTSAGTNTAPRALAAYCSPTKPTTSKAT